MDVGTKKTKLEKLEAIRGFVAIYVFIMHFYAHVIRIHWDGVWKGIDFNPLFGFGASAVLSFFVLSGFVIQYSFTKSGDHSFKLYFFKRFTRIYIPLITVFIISAILYTNTKYDNFSWRLLLGNLLMFQDIPLKPGVICTVLYGNGPLWSLSYEWYYYMLYFPLTVYVFRKWTTSPKLIYLIIIIAALSHWFHIFALNRWLLYLSFWWLGRDVAVLYMKEKAINFRNLALPLLTILACILILVIPEKLNYIDGDYASVFRENYKIMYTMLIIILLVILWHKTGWLLYNYTIRPFRHFASISYGIYISHYPLVMYAEYLEKWMSASQYYILKFVIYTAIMLVFSYFIERILFVKVSRFLQTKIFKAKTIS